MNDDMRAAVEASTFLVNTYHVWGAGVADIRQRDYLMIVCDLRSTFGQQAAEGFRQSVGDTTPMARSVCYFWTISKSEARRLYAGPTADLIREGEEQIFVIGAWGLRGQGIPTIIKGA